ncbi:hypothetical protein HOY34_08640 [Xinfangfangia sp. D13-10-4-6]|uniref:hypothetical protein n=1 Tax=Pseudogemmobacter hezensis TaxID=2737662 RepID=UPI0015558AAD|nr:hypothetical protein [Pseudogemmobacter hezensis]NPD15265.1 hypothetical protein [Pseudogemmobacter hezensis]
MSSPTAPCPAPSDALASRPGAEWLAAMEGIAEDDGYLDPLGDKHWAFFAETGSTLLVTFEQAEQIRARPDTLPEGMEIARKNGWSLLCLIAEGETFWRAPEVWGYFDRLVDDAFFDDFDQVLFYGTGPSGYAAGCYVVTAPGARALLLSPRATMDPSLTGWDHRNPATRRLDFTSRYGYAPDMTEGASQVWLIHDPTVAADNAHAALFRRPWVSIFATRFAGEHPERILGSAGILEKVIGHAMAGTLTSQVFADLWRARRGSAAYLKRLMATAVANGRSRFEEVICRAGATRLSARRFVRRLAEIEARQKAARNAGRPPAPRPAQQQAGQQQAGQQQASPARAQGL